MRTKKNIRFRTFWYISIVLIFASFASIQTIQAQNEEGARQFVSSFFKQTAPTSGMRTRSASVNAITTRYRSAGNTPTSLFVFQQEENGFAIVAQSNNTFKVVGYAEKGDFLPDDIPPQLQSLMKFYEDSLQFMNVAAVPFIAGTPVVKPLLDQYGIMLDQFRHSQVGGCPTGCIATAVTQIMLYHSARTGKPIKGYGSHCYTDGKYGQICADFENADYANNNELLSFHVGNAMEMQYCGSSYGSIPNRGIYPIKEHFRFYTGNAIGDDFFIKDELNSERPVYTAFKGSPVGHAIVIDGYDDRGYFHLNFGWGGKANGYYLLNRNERMAFSPFVFFTNIVSPVVISPTVIPVVKEDSLALVAVHNALGGKEITGWELAEPVSSWNGVLVSKSRVISLELYLMAHPPKTQQSLSPEIGKLTGLRNLNLAGCFNGTIPESIANLTALQQLSIINNAVYIYPTLHKGNLKGQLPSNIGNLTKLERLAISNALEGAIPTSIGNLSNLKYIRVYQDTTYFGRGKLSGNFPSGIGNLKKLQTLDISNHQLTGALPPSFNNLPELQFLDLSGNQLSGIIAALSFPRLKNLKLSDNALSGLSDGLWNCPELLSFLANNNQIKGAIPEGFSSMFKLEHLDLSGNQIESLPENIGNLMNLKTIDLSNNKIKIVPYSASDWTNLTKFTASNNQIESIPENFGQFPYLQGIDMSKNRLTFIPEELGNCAELGGLRFNSNKIEKIPETLVNLRANASIYLQDNEIEGEIPEKLMTLAHEKDERYLRLDSNRFVFDDIPKSAKLKFGVKDQKNATVNKQVFNVQMGDTVTLDVRKLTRLADADNQYYWTEYPKHVNNMSYDDRMSGIANNPLIRIVIDEKTVKNKYYCKVFNPKSPSYTYEGRTVPCMYYVNTDTIAFRLAADEELISEKYDGNYVASTKNIPQKTVEDRFVTLVPPVKVRGSLTWQGSTDGKTWHDISETMVQPDLKANFVRVKSNELVLSPKTPAYYRCSVQDTNCEPLYSDTLKVNPFGKILFDETVNVSEEAKTISLDSIELIIPKNFHNKEFRLTVSKIDNPPAAPDSVTAGSAFDVSVNFDSDTLQVPLIIKLRNVDRKKINDRDIDKFQAAYFDEKEHKWKVYEHAHISLKDSLIVFETNHLTKLRWWHREKTVWGFTNMYERNNIEVYYKESDLQFMEFNYGKRQTPKSWHVSGEPLLVQDITEYLSVIIAKYDSLGLKGPGKDGKFKVYLKQMDNEGCVGIPAMFMGYMLINSTILTPDLLKTTLAHEFMHYTQDYYISAHSGNLFWMEAHATLADRMVWNKNDLPVSEPEQLFRKSLVSQNSIFNFLANSWDFWDKSILQENAVVDGGNVFYDYLAGTFLHYMRNYRSKPEKLNPATLLAETSWLGSWRIYLGNYVSKYLKSTLSTEYEDFIKFILSAESENFTLINKKGNPYSFIQNPQNKQVFTHSIRYSFHENDSVVQKDELNIKIPYLAAKIVLLENSSPKKMLLVNYKRKHQYNYKQAVYHGIYNVETGKTTYKEISKDEKYNFLIEAKTTTNLKEYKNYNFLVFINKEYAGISGLIPDFDASFELTAMPVLNIEDIGMLQIYNGSEPIPYNFDDGSKRIIGFGHIDADAFERASGITTYGWDYSSSKQLVSDSTYRISNHYALISDQGIIMNEPTMKDSTVYTQTIDHNVYSGIMKITEVEKKILRLHPYIQLPSENVLSPSHVYQTREISKTYWLKDIMKYAKPKSDAVYWEVVYGKYIVLFETGNTYETRDVVDK